ncbi:VOC family protein [Agromyces seonyuensis]|uniref:VOC family protein n=1 Tax=Agromyces seonyuensis TaxID=2662446 RepID=A0A6I4P2H4_9MICO|nr:VOC family protein [Agromyces seonyuensis]MWB99812.1 VOC family protein [Agromyces seonyuensis]
MANLVVHFEIHASDPEAAITFYSDLLDWTFTEAMPGQYWVIGTGEGARTGPDTPGFGINGGLVQRRGPKPEVGGPVTGADLVIAVDDVDAIHARGIELGGVDAVAPMDMPGVGRMAYLLDPDGNVFGFLNPVTSDGVSQMGM